MSSQEDDLTSEMPEENKQVDKYELLLSLAVLLIIGIAVGMI